MKLVAILRIKDQILTIDDVMTKLSEIADDIIIVDGYSTDGTFERYKQYPKIKKVIQLAGFHEGRDKILLLEEARKLDPDWILWLDADEVFEKHFTREVVEKYMHSPYNRIDFRMCNFWLSKELFRYDYIYYLYTLHPQRSMWRNVPQARFKDQKMHNGGILDVPKPYYISPYRLKHFGYLYEKKIADRLERCLTEDPDSTRDYKGTLDVKRKARYLRFREYDSATLNMVYIQFYKYLCNSLWIVERLRLKLKKLLHIQ